MLRRLGRYELLHRLGAGGGGEVWDAELHGPAGFRRRVAVKVLNPGASGGEAEASLLHEARLGGLIAHPNVVGALELGQQDGRWFVVMDLVRGCSASQLRKSTGPLPPAALLDIGVQVCAGLHHIHGLTDDDGWPLDLVHRDIKPGNLMVDRSHRVRIVDLGIARLLGTPEVPAGTPGFVAPEQLVGEEDPRADLFSLGVTLTRLAVGRFPFGKGRAALMKVSGPQADAFATDAALVGALDAYLDGLGGVLSRAMRADPEDRWPTARAFEEALRSLYWACPTSRRLGSLDVPIGGGSVEASSGLTGADGGFVGRAAELDALRDLLARGTRWTVLVGPGGVGKTRLLDEAVRARSPIRVDASRARSLRGLCTAIAEACSASVGEDPVASVAKVLEGVDLLVLDEVERVAEALGRAVPTWLEAVEGLQVVCSSRRVISAPAATLVRIGPMSMDEARQLFAARVGAEVPDDVLEPLLRALDRLPLAVELAAARARKTSPERVLAQLQVTSAARVPGVREALEASWELLEPDERDALVRLSAYEGPFDAPDAVAVLDRGGDALGQLERLADHSMLQVRRNRFRLLTSIRAFARDRLPEARAAGERRHGQWLARLGEQEEIGRILRSGETPPQVSALDDLIVASRRALRRGDGEVAVATALAAARALRFVGPAGAVPELVESVLPLGLREAEVLKANAIAVFELGRMKQAEGLFRRARERAEGLAALRLDLHLETCRMWRGDRSAMEPMARAVEALAAAGEEPAHMATHQVTLGQAFTLCQRLEEAAHYIAQGLATRQREGLETVHASGALGRVQYRRGRFADAITHMERAVEDAKRTHDVVGQALWEENLAWVLRDVGALGEAERIARDALQSARVTGRAPIEAPARAMLADLAIDRGDLEAAEAHAKEAQVAARRSDDDDARCYAHLALSRLRFAQGRHEEAQRSLELAHRGDLQLDNRSWVALAFGLHGDPATSLALVAEVQGQAAPEDWLVRANTHLARAAAELRSGRLGAARAALLQASQALGHTDLTRDAPLFRLHARLREELAHASR